MSSVLWDRVAAFRFDGPDEAYGFSLRLAKENYWTQQFTAEAVLEYRRFMYLAAITDGMVAPSETVDTVWHQHLVFLESYQQFGRVLGKAIQHVPATHARGDGNRFGQARERTRALYEQHFGAPPDAIWRYAGMYESLRLPKARFDLRVLLLGAVAGLGGALLPLYFLLYPVYAHLSSAVFMPSLAVGSVLTFGGLWVYNRQRVAQIVRQFDPASFALRLQPAELIYLKTRRLSAVIHGVVNDLLTSDRIRVVGDEMIGRAPGAEATTPAEAQVMRALTEEGGVAYPELLRRLTDKPVFTNLANSMEAFEIVWRLLRSTLRSPGSLPGFFKPT